MIILCIHSGNTRVEDADRNWSSSFNKSAEHAAERLSHLKYHYDLLVYEL